MSLTRRAAVLAAAGREYTGRLADQRTVLPGGERAVPEIFHWCCHVAEAYRAAQCQPDAFVEIAGFDVGDAGIRDGGSGRFANGGYPGNRA